MPRLASLIAAFVLALPGAAFAQGAGDDQYQDPFGDSAGQTGTLTQAPNVSGGGTTSAPSRSSTTGGGSGSAAGGGSGSAGRSGGSGASGSADPSRRAGGSDRAADEATGRGQLPHTGTDARLLILVGAAFVLAGIGLRLRTIDPDAF